MSKRSRDRFNYPKEFNEALENPLISAYTREAPIRTAIANERLTNDSGSKIAFIEDTFGTQIQTPGYQNSIVGQLKRHHIPTNQDYKKTAKWVVKFTNFFQF